MACCGNGDCVGRMLMDGGNSFLMPSVSKAQHRLMAASCKGASDAVPRKVACEWMHEDKGRVKELPTKLSDYNGRKKKKSKWKM